MLELRLYCPYGTGEVIISARDVHTTPRIAVKCKTVVCVGALCDVCTGEHDEVLESRQLIKRRYFASDSVSWRYPQLQQLISELDRAKDAAMDLADTLEDWAGSGSTIPHIHADNRVVREHLEHVFKDPAAYEPQPGAQDRITWQAWAIFARSPEDFVQQLAEIARS